MANIENALDEALEPTKKALITVTFLGNSIREWQLYSGDVQETQESINQALSEFREYPLSITNQQDP